MKYFEKMSSRLAIAAGVCAFLYSLSFVVVSKDNPIMGGVLAALLLTVFGILSSGAWVGLYEKLKEVDPGFAIWVTILGTVSAVGAFIHGGYDLTSTLNPITGFNADLASQIDPRGLLTFGLSGFSLIMGSIMISAHPKMPKKLGNLGYVAGLLSIFLYLARLIVMNANSMIITVPAIIGGFVIIPLWYIWVGLVLKKSYNEDFENVYTEPTVSEAVKRQKKKKA